MVIVVFGFNVLLFLQSILKLSNVHQLLHHGFLTDSSVLHQMKYLLHNLSIIACL